MRMLQKSIDDGNERRSDINDMDGVEGMISDERKGVRNTGVKARREISGKKWPTLRRTDYEVEYR